MYQDWQFVSGGCQVSHDFARRERIDFTGGGESGESVYMGAAEDWLELDQDRFGLIAAAGFSAQNWVRAYDETLLGFAGGISNAEIDAQISEAEAAVAASPLAAEQKTMILEDFHAQMAEVRIAVRDGQQFASAVAPVRARLQRLMEGF